MLLPCWREELHRCQKSGVLWGSKQGRAQVPNPPEAAMPQAMVASEHNAARCIPHPPIVEQGLCHHLVEVKAVLLEEPVRLKVPGSPHVVRDP